MVEIFLSVYFSFSFFVIKSENGANNKVSHQSEPSKHFPFLISTNRIDRDIYPQDND
jgi:hypothetical protein